MSEAPGYRIEFDTPQGGQVVGAITGEGNYTTHDLALVSELLSIAAHGALPPPKGNAALSEAPK